MGTPVTQHLCHILTQTHFENLPAAVVTVAKRIMLDGIAVAVAGSLEDGPRIAAAHAKSLGGRPVSSVLGAGFKTSPVSAASVNGTAMHVLDYEPMWSPPTHATSPTLPTILALAETERADGRTLIAAFAKGCEIQGRIRLASHQHTPAQLKYHPPGVVGVMGSAVAAAHVLGLDQRQLGHALGTAASRAGGIMANVGTMTKATHCGWAAAAGLDAALLARRGFSANTEIFEAPNGYIEVFFAEGFDTEKLLDFGHPYRLVDPGFVIKLFPSQYATHFAISTGLELHRQLDTPAAIASVELTTPVMPYVDRPAPQSGLDGKFSFQYTLATALLDGAVTIDSFSDERRFGSDMQTLLPKISLVQSDTIPGQLEKMWVETRLTLKDGSRLHARCTGPQGCWGLPPLEREDHLLKVRTCLQTRLNQEETERCIQAVETLETRDATAVRALIHLAACLPA